MSLRRKTILSVLATIVVAGLVVFVVSSRILTTSFLNLETEFMQRNAGRVRDALAAELAAMQNYATDWGNWDEAYRYLDDRNQMFVTANFGPNTLAGLRMNLIALYDTAGRPVQEYEYDLVHGRALPTEPAIDSLFHPGSPLLRDRDTAGLSGLAMLAGKPLLLAIRPILTTDRTGPARGTLVMGRLLDSAEVALLAVQTHLSVALLAPGDPRVPRQRQGEAAAVKPLGRQFVAAYAPVRDLFGREPLVLEVSQERSIVERGRTAISWLLIALLAVCLALGGLSVLQLETLVLGRLSRLTRDVVALGTDREGRPPVEERGRDELAMLGHEINHTVAALAEAQQAVRSSEERLRDLFDGTSDLIQMVQPDGRLAYVNRAWLKVLDYRPDDVASLSFYDVVAPDHRESCGEMFRRLMAGESLGDVQTAFIGRGGHRIEVEGNISCRFVNGRPENTRGIFRDVTQRNRMLAELKKTNEELAQSNRDLADAGRQRRELMDIAMMHDFGTPMTVVQGYAELLRDGVLGPVADKQKKAVEAIYTNLKSLDALRSQMLEVFGFDRGDVALELVDARLGELILTSVADLGILINERNMDVQVRVPDTPVRCDPARIRQVVRTYLAGMVKYADDGMRVLVAAGPDNIHMHVVFSVEMSNPVAGSSQDRFGAWGGLGMALADAIIVAHHGKAWIERVAGADSRLHFTLLLAQTADHL